MWLWLIEGAQPGDDLGVKCVVALDEQNLQRVRIAGHGLGDVRHESLIVHGQDSTLDEPLDSSTGWVRRDARRIASIVD